MIENKIRYECTVIDDAAKNLQYYVIVDNLTDKYVTNKNNDLMYTIVSRIGIGKFSAVLGLDMLRNHCRDLNEVWYDIGMYETLIEEYLNA